MIPNFFYTLGHYTAEILPALAIGLLLSGVIHEFLPQVWVNRHLNRKGLLPILYATFTGIILPLCCFGSLPVVIGLRKKGVPLGPVLAFLVATPATSITAILVAWRLLGIGFTLYLCISVILIGLVMGLIGNLFPFKPAQSPADSCPVCAEGEHKKHHHHKKNLKSRIISVLSFGFIDIPKEIGLELVIAVILAALVASITPLGDLIRNYLFAGLGYLFALVFGLVMYICSTASVPFVHAFINQGLNTGAGLVLLIVGPITSYGTILVIRKEFGFRILSIYLAVISSSALILGYILSLF